MDIREVVYSSLQADWGDQPIVTVEDLMDTACGYRHVLQLQGAVPNTPEPGPKILLREAGIEAKKTIRKYLKGSFGKKYKPGYTRLHNSVQFDIDGFLGETLIDVSLQSTLFYNEVRPSKQSVLVAATKAALVGASEVLLITVDRDKQAWSFWKLSGALSTTARPVLEDIAYIQAVIKGTGTPVGMASARTCKRCPFSKGACSLEPVGDPEPYEADAVVVEPWLDLRIQVDGYLWGLNQKPNGRRTKVIHPSEISITNCDRVLAYGLLGEKEVPTTSAPLRRIFDFGHVFHNVLQRSLQMLPGFAAEVPVADEELRIFGNCDGITRPIGFEFKSIGSKGFSGLTAAKTEHKKQGVIYGALLDLTKILYVYANKETGDLAVFDPPLDMDVWHATATRAATIVATVRRGEMPEGTGTDYQCSQCKYGWKCKPKLGAAPSEESRKLRRFGR